MKTEPTEAYFKEPENTFREWIKSVRTIKENLLFIADHGRINGSLLLDVLKLMQRSFEKGQSSPKIKKLEWKEVYNSIFNTDTGFKYSYEIHDNDNGVTILFDSSGGNPKRFINLKEAKAAAQSDFERRVMECLINE